MTPNQYITQDQIGYVFSELNYEMCDDRRKEDLVMRAIGDFESDMAEKFVVPLVGRDVPYDSTPQYARVKVYAALKAKLKELIGYDQNKTLTGTAETTEKFLNVHGQEYTSLKKSIINHKIDYGFLLLDYAQDSQVPVQKLRLSRADNSESTEADD